MMDIQGMSKQTLALCRKQSWAALETGISRPVPIIRDTAVQLAYLLYRSHVQLPYQLLYEPFAQVSVDSASGQIVEHVELPVSDPPKVLGRYPHAAVAKIDSTEMQRIWDELFGLYPIVIEAFAGRSAPGQRDKVRRFAELFDLTTPPFFKEAYRTLNAAFFEWLERAGTVS